MPEAEILVLGDGSWGTALALSLCRAGQRARLYGRDSERSALMQATRENRKYLPGARLPEGVTCLSNPKQAAEGVQLLLSVVPTQRLGAALTHFKDLLPADLPVVSASKGLEVETFRTPTEIIVATLGERPTAVLTGPSHAEEVALGLPASLVACSTSPALAETVQRVLSSETLRIYTSTDPHGAELAAALKNVIALAAGICDGIGLGDNAKAALITRGVVEMARFGRQQGAAPETFFGLAGIGDLMTTCYSRHSRNRSVGEAIGRGKTLEQVLEGMHMVAEGVWTVRALFGPEAESLGTSMPIAEEVYACLFEGKPPKQAVSDLMRRAPREELTGVLLPPGS